MSQAVISNQRSVFAVQRPHFRTQRSSRQSSSRQPLLALLRLIFMAICMLAYSVVSTAVAVTMMICLVLAPVFLLFGGVALIGLILHLVGMFLHGLGVA